MNNDQRRWLAVINLNLLNLSVQEWLQCKEEEDDFHFYPATDFMMCPVVFWWYVQIIYCFLPVFPLQIASQSIHCIYHQQNMRHIRKSVVGWNWELTEEGNVYLRLLRELNVMMMRAVGHFSGVFPSLLIYKWSYNCLFISWSKYLTCMWLLVQQYGTVYKQRCQKSSIMSKVRESGD